MVRIKQTALKTMVFSLLFCSCTLILPPLKVISWSPGSETTADPDTVNISIVFNHEPDMILTEEAFSISNLYKDVPGKISWEGATLMFSPYDKLPVNSEYIIRIDASAEDPNGISLAEDFTVSFRTGRSDSRPVITSVNPADKTFINNRYTDIVIFFNKAVDFNSLLSELSITPDIRGISHLDSEGKTFTFTPVEPLKLQQEYTVKLSPDILSSSGYSLADEYEFCFTISDDITPPEILYASSKSNSIELTELKVATGWEKNNAVRLHFSEEVELDSVDSAVSIEPAAEFEISIDETAEPSEVIICFPENLEWHVLYSLIISTAVRDHASNNMARKAEYKFFIDGESSEPPTLCRADFIQEDSAVCFFNSAAPETAVDSHRILDTSEGDALQNPFYFDFYFNLAEGASLPFFEFTQNFIINPLNSCITLNYLNFQLFNPGESTSIAAAPKPTPSDTEAVLRLITELSDSKTLSDIISFRVYSSLTDSLGNSMPEDWNIELFDEDN